MHGLAERFAAGLEEVVGYLNGTRPGGLAGDPAIDGCADNPIR